MAEALKETQKSKPKPQNCGKTARSGSTGLRKMYLERGWVIANHKLVSFHAAFISSILSLPAAELAKQAGPGAEHIKSAVLQFIFAPWNYEVYISLIILYLSWHISIAIHEMGHFLTAAKLTALNKDSQEKADAILKGGGGKFGLYAQMLLLIPWGKFYGVKKENGNFAPDAPYNLAVAASAPVWSGYMALICLPTAIVLIAIGLLTNVDFLIYVGRRALRSRSSERTVCRDAP